MQVTTETLKLPTSEQLNEIYHFLGTSDANIDADVKTIAEWMRKQPHLPDPEVDERRIRVYLIFCKNRMEKTKVTLDRYYTIKSTMPEFFANRDPTSTSILKSMNTLFYLPLPKLTEDSKRVSLCRFRTLENDSFDFAYFAMATFMAVDIRVSILDMFRREICILDLKHLTMSHVTAAFPLLKKFVICALNAYPTWFQQLHILNLPSYAQPLVNMVLGLLKKNTIKIFSHCSIEDLKQNLSPDVLPLDYGGKLPKTSDELAEDWKEEMIKHKEWFLSQNSIVCDEFKRIKKSTRNVNLISGVEGSFKRLEVD